ncbi:IS493-like transposase [Streptomyces sp. W007]|nr:IS493-like transposase [Streptomyces sp. W007]
MLARVVRGVGGDPVDRQQSRSGAAVSSDGKRRHNSSHAKIRCLGEQAMATLKGWRLLRKLRCSTNRITPIVKAVLALYHTSS